MSDELFQHPGVPAIEPPAFRRPSRHGIGALRDAVAFEGTDHELVEHFTAPDAFTFELTWTKDGDPVGRCEFVVQHDAVRWNGLWLEEGWYRRGVYRHIVRDLAGPLLEMGVRWWVIADNTEASDNTEQGREVFLRSGFEAVDGWLVADRGDPDSPMNRWAGR